MHDALRMRAAESSGDLARDVKRAPDLQGSGVHHVTQAAALDELEREKHRAVRQLSEVRGGRDVRVIDVGGRHGLALEARNELGHARKLAVQHLDGELLAHEHVLGGVHLAHPTLAERRFDPVTLREHRSGRQFGRGTARLLAISVWVVALGRLGCGFRLLGGRLGRVREPSARPLASPRPVASVSAAGFGAARLRGRLRLRHGFRLRGGLRLRAGLGSTSAFDLPAVSAGAALGAGSVGGAADTAGASALGVGSTVAGGGGSGCGSGFTSAGAGGGGAGSSAGERVRTKSAPPIAAMAMAMTAMRPMPLGSPPSLPSSAGIETRRADVGLVLFGPVLFGPGALRPGARARCFSRSRAPDGRLPPLQRPDAPCRHRSLEPTSSEPVP